VALAEEVDGGAGLDEEEKLRGLFDGEEVGDGLLDAVVEELEIFAAKAFDEAAGAVGYGYSAKSTNKRTARIGCPTDTRLMAPLVLIWCCLTA
jgi:hypothetical protein